MPTPAREIVNAEMEAAYRAAVESVEAEKRDPAEIQAARRRALLRWLDGGA